MKFNLIMINLFFNRNNLDCKVAMFIVYIISTFHTEVITFYKIASKHYVISKILKKYLHI